MMVFEGFGLLFAPIRHKLGLGRTEPPSNKLATPRIINECGDGLSLRSTEALAGRRLPVHHDSARIPLWKRILDISCVLIAIPSLLPLIVLISALIKLTSRGPILFKQERIGFLGREFTLFKFRTMIVGADTETHQLHVARVMEGNQPMTKLDRHGDTRLIRVGRLLRASGLDELPQLINVLRGEMSIVGPRPCLPSEYSKYSTYQTRRSHALPGLTGLWQVSGKNRLTFSEMIECDIKYVRTQSLWLDVQIMVRTIPTVIAEVKDSQQSAAGAARIEGKTGAP
jgi:lipopolysaccharide/colanic/teichoic acid biosynthesis glycosyltransferase